MPDRTARSPAELRQLLHSRAQVVAALRRALDERGVLEVQTACIVGAPVSDPNLQSLLVLDAAACEAPGSGAERFFQTSPEYLMKRLLVAGSGDIWQLCPVARAGERGRLHNPEFTMLEWYRLDWDMERLIDEVAALCNLALAALGKPARPVTRLRYRDAFQDALQLDPLVCDDAALREAVAPLNLSAPTRNNASRDELLDLLMGAVIGPGLGRGDWCFVTHYPASQAALARLDPVDPRVALRFELYADGIELANGFDELADAGEQCARFEADNALRRQRGLPVYPLDRRLLDALAAGLPACSGVAVGVDRLLMVACGARHIDAVLPFAWEDA